MASDSRGHAAAAYAWRSSISGDLSASASFVTTALPVGNHVIALKVQCANGTWSAETTVQVKVRKRASLSTPKTSGSASARKGTTFTGTVNPHRSTTVKLQVQKYSRGSYHTYKTYTLKSGSSGSWKYKVKLKKAKYRVRTTTAETSTYFSATSSWHKVTVK